MDISKTESYELTSDDEPAPPQQANGEEQASLSTTMEVASPYNTNTPNSHQPLRPLSPPDLTYALTPISIIEKEDPLLKIVGIIYGYIFGDRLLNWMSDIKYEFDLNTIKWN